MGNSQTNPNDIEFGGYRPGVLGDVVKLHMDYYGPAWDFGLAFEAKVAGEMAEFLARMDPTQDLLLSGYGQTGEMLASITLDGADVETDGAHIRWFITSAQGRGCGLGRTLLDRAVSFSDEKGYSKIYLTTFAGLDAARRLYEDVGFQLVSESDIDQWQGGVREQRFERSK